jgi:serine protease Do
MKKFLNLFFAAVLGGAFALGLNHFMFDNSPDELPRPVFNTTIDQPPASLARYITQLPTTLPDFTLVAEMTVNSVVHIRTEYERKSSVYDDYFGGIPEPFRDFFAPRRRDSRRPIVATGSGVIVRENGYIITNNHVVAEADFIEVTLNDNRTFEAKIVGTDPSTDLALIKIEKEGLPAVPFGDSDEARIGEWVLAVGNPFNLNSTVTAGIISAKGRNINILGGGATIESFIQTDAAVNRGNSGGALVNSQGELIGINAAIASSTGSFTGYSFAIPINIAAKVMEDLMEFGEVQRGLLGVEIVELNSQRARELNLDIVRGVYIADYSVENSAAKQAGLKAGDVIIGIDGQPVRTTADLQEMVGRKRPGDDVLVRYYRNGTEHETRATLRNVYGEKELVARETRSVNEKLGARLEPMSSTELRQLNIRHGVRVTSVGPGPLRNAGIRDGFVITHLDREPVRSPEELVKVLENKSGGVLVEGVAANGTRQYFGLGIK